MSDMIWEILSSSQCPAAQNEPTQVELATNLWHTQARLANLRLRRFRGRFIFLSPLSPLGRLIATLTAAFIVGRPNSSLREGQSRPPARASAHPCDDRDSRLGRAERLQQRPDPFFSITIRRRRLTDFLPQSSRGQLVQVNDMRQDRGGEREGPRLS